MLLCSYKNLILKSNVQKHRHPIIPKQFLCDNKVTLTQFCTMKFEMANVLTLNINNWQEHYGRAQSELGDEMIYSYDRANGLRAVFLRDYSHFVIIWSN